MKTYIFIPPVRRPTGGVAVLVRMAELLTQAGFEAHLVPREKQMAEQLYHAAASVVPWENLQLSARDVWMVPEGWVNALAPGLQAGARCVAYVQNWAYLFSSLPQGVHWNQLRASFLAVSHPVAWFIEQTTGRPSAILRPGIDLELFSFRGKKPGAPVRIAYMPRKNKAMAEQVRAIFESRRGMDNPQCGEVRWVEIHNQPPARVAELMRDCHIFLATGFPEGFGLPPLEAMACGCLPVGFTGFGGWDYMRQAVHEGLDLSVRPWWPLRPRREAAWDGNGFWVHDADVLAAALALEEAVAWWLEPDERLTHLLTNARQTTEHYSLERQRQSLVELWSAATEGRLFT